MTGTKSPQELLAPALRLATAGRLYPSVIVHGASESDRRAAAVTLARALLCERDAGLRPCGVCRHCSRIALPSGDEERFHPDFAWLDRDLKTSTSAESTRDLLRAAQLTPFEARGQVFVVGDAASLSGEASDSLLKAIEEPGLKAPRNFFLVAPSRSDLSPTLRSRSLAVYLGSGERPEPERVRDVALAVRTSLARAAAAPPGARGFDGLDIATRLAAGADFTDPRATAPWLFAAAVAREAALLEGEPALDRTARRRLLALAEALLTASPLRLRGMPPERILEGIVNDRLFG